MTKAQKAQSKFAALLARAIATTFDKAYSMRALGHSQDEILIDYDIQAAASTQADEITQCGRQTIKAAVRACESGVPFFVARLQIMLRVNDRIEALLTEAARKQQRRKKKP